MKLPKRFALSTLLLSMFVVASIFGFAQWRRQALIAEVESLRDAGVEWLVVDGNLFWPTVSKRALISVANVSSVMDADAAEIRRHILLLQNRARALGVNDITYELVVMKNYRVVGTRRMRLADMNQLDMFEIEPYEESLNRILSDAMFER